MKNLTMWVLIAAGSLLLSRWISFDPQQQAIEQPKQAEPLKSRPASLQDKPSPPPHVSAPSRTFGGYQCIGDCSDDKAGYRWAQQNGITDPDSCTGNTGAFIDGCRVYARERAAASLNQ